MATVKLTKSKSKVSDGCVVAEATLAAEKTRIVLVPAASSCSAFNYYANNDAEREAASARFRATVASKPTTRRLKKG